MPRFDSKLLGRSEVAEGTTAFALERPAGFHFTAGQHLTLTLPQPPHDDAKGNARTFSIASAPQETEHLLIATRMTGSALKRSLAEVPLGTPLSLVGPAGSFTLYPDASAPVVFVAGGIGITPFRSMVLDAANRGLSRQITLVYSNRTPEATAFHEEFERLAATHRHFRYLPTMTNAEDTRRTWNGERRSVSAALLRDCIGDIARSTFYVAGPPGLVAVATQAVLEAGAHASRVHAEEFAGYEAKQAATAARERQPAARFRKVAKTGELAPGQGKAVSVNGAAIALFNVDGEYYAIDDSCPHAGGVLSEGELTGKELTCPLHGAVFDVTTGEVLGPPADEGVACYKVRVSGGDIEVEI
jgi:ferredoxin-NADP reductase